MTKEGRKEGRAEGTERGRKGGVFVFRAVFFFRGTVVSICSYGRRSVIGAVECLTSSWVSFASYFITAVPPHHHLTSSLQCAQLILREHAKHASSNPSLHPPRRLTYVPCCPIKIPSKTRENSCSNSRASVNGGDPVLLAAFASPPSTPNGVVDRSSIHGQRQGDGAGGGAGGGSGEGGSFVPSPGSVMVQR